MGRWVSVRLFSIFWNMWEGEESLWVSINNLMPSFKMNVHMCILHVCAQMWPHVCATLCNIICVSSHPFVSATCVEHMCISTSKCMDLCICKRIYGWMCLCVCMCNCVWGCVCMCVCARAHAGLFLECLCVLCTCVFMNRKKTGQTLNHWHISLWKGGRGILFPLLTSYCVCV